MGAAASRAATTAATAAASAWRAPTAAAPTQGEQSEAGLALPPEIWLHTAKSAKLARERAPNCLEGAGFCLRRGLVPRRCAYASSQRSAGGSRVDLAGRRPLSHKATFAAVTQGGTRRPQRHQNCFEGRGQSDDGLNVPHLPPRRASSRGRTTQMIHSVLLPAGSRWSSAHVGGPHLLVSKENTPGLGRPPQKGHPLALLRAVLMP
jgi:hypothetical protein